MNHLQLFGSVGIALEIFFILYTLYQTFAYLGTSGNGDYVTARKIKRRVNVGFLICVVMLVLLLIPTFIWPR